MITQRSEIIPCADCGRWDIGIAHWCGPEPVFKPVCAYCWAPVEPRPATRASRRWWAPAPKPPNRYCSDACRKLYGRSRKARLITAPAARALIAEVAATAEALAA